LERCASDLDQQLAARAAASLAQHWIKSKLPAKAPRLARRIKTKHPDVLVSGNLKGADFADSIVERIKPASEVRSIQKFDQVETTSTTVSNPVRLNACRVVLKNSDVPKYETYQFRFLLQTGEFSIFDAHGREIYKFYARRQQKDKIDTYNQYTIGRISIKDDLALVDIAREIFVFDFDRLQTNQDPLLWYKGLPDHEQDHSLNAVSEAWGELVSVSPPRNDVICYFDAPNLIAVDARTGDKIWQRQSRFSGSILLGNEQLLASWNPNR